MRPTDPNHFFLAVGDDGAGLPQEVDIQNPQRLGLQIVSDLVKQLDGKVEVDRTGGSAFRITF